MLVNLLSFLFYNSIFTIFSCTPLSKSSPNVMFIYLDGKLKQIERQKLKIADILFMKYTPSEYTQLIKMYKQLGMVK